MSRSQSRGWTALLHAQEHWPPTFSFQPCIRERIMCCGVVVPTFEHLDSLRRSPLHVKKPNKRVVHFIRPCSFALFLPRTPDGRRLLGGLARNAWETTVSLHAAHQSRTKDGRLEVRTGASARPSKLFSPATSKKSCTPHTHSTGSPTSCSLPAACDGAALWKAPLRSTHPFQSLMLAYHQLSPSVTYHP